MARKLRKFQSASVRESPISSIGVAVAGVPNISRQLHGGGDGMKASSFSESQGSSSREFRQDISATFCGMKALLFCPSRISWA
jgi:hypothetical protein